MKLVYRITLRLSIALLILMATWGAIFYFVIIDEINDETDDSLEDYSEMIIMHALGGQSLPLSGNGSNNSYYIKSVSAEYAAQNRHIRYSDETVYIETKRETEPARVLNTIFRDSNSKFYELTVLIPTIEKDDLKETILYWIVALYMALLLVIIVINVFIFHRSFRPLYKLLHWLDGFSVNREPAPLNNETGITEFRRLNNAVLKNARRNMEMYEQQKDFIGNASHELQTPLAICQNRLEMLLYDDTLSETQLKEVTEIRHTLNRIVKLNKTLLLLSKIENGQFPEKENVNINRLLKSLVDDYGDICASRNITISVEEKGEMTVQLNQTLVSVLIGNLLKNACVHNFDGGTIKISIDSTHAAFANTGTVQPLDENKIFKRFYRDSKREGSSGLGLAMVASICKSSDIGIHYSFSEGKHCFVLKNNSQ